MALEPAPPLASVDELTRAAQAPIDDYHYVAFDSPSGNITCSWHLGDAGIDSNLHCDLLTRTTPKPPRPADCPENAGPGWATNYVRLSAAGAQDGVCTGGIQTPATANVVPYNSALTAGDYGCLPAEAGVTCVHIPTGRGFFVARATFTPF